MPNGPMPGDAVILTGEVSLCLKGDFGIIDGMRFVDQRNHGEGRIGVKGILEKHGVTIPEGKEVW